MDLRKDGKQRSTADAKQYVAEFNYEFLDDYQDKGFGQLSMSCFAKNSSNNILEASEDEMEKNKGFAAKWGPQGFSRWDHPLGLMVSWFE